MIAVFRVVQKNEQPCNKKKKKAEITIEFRHMPLISAYGIPYICLAAPLINDSLKMDDWVSAVNCAHRVQLQPCNVQTTWAVLLFENSSCAIWVHFTTWTKPLLRIIFHCCFFFFSRMWRRTKKLSVTASIVRSTIYYLSIAYHKLKHEQFLFNYHADFKKKAKNKNIYHLNSSINSSRKNEKGNEFIRC